MGGFHGSIRKKGLPIYYSVDVYSERRANGTANGIPVFKDSWKNVVATLYHELNMPERTQMLVTPFEMPTIRIRNDIWAGFLIAETNVVTILSKKNSRSAQS